MTDYLNPLPAIGGPCHGGFYSHDRRRMEVPAEPPEKPTEFDPAKLPPVVSMTSYRRVAMRVRHGALCLEGEAWVWDRLSDDEARRLAFGMILSGAMR